MKEMLYLNCHFSEGPPYYPTFVKRQQNFPCMFLRNTKLLTATNNLVKLNFQFSIKWIFFLNQSKIGVIYFLDRNITFIVSKVFSVLDYCNVSYELQH